MKFTEVYGRNLPKPSDTKYRSLGEKLTVADVVAIRKAAGAGVSKEILAKQYDVSPSYLSQVISHNVWVDVANYTPRRKLTDEDVAAIRKAAAEGTSWYTLAERYNITYAYVHAIVQHKARKLLKVEEVPIDPSRHKLTVTDVLEIRRLRTEGVTCEEIGKRFKVSRQHVWLVVNRKAWNQVKDSYVSPKDFRPFFTDEEVVAIRKAASKGASCAELGKLYNVSTTAIWNVVNCITYKHGQDNYIPKLKS